MKLDRWNLYIQEGREAVEIHPDYPGGGIDFLTAASDMIASILHACDQYGQDNDDDISESEPESVLARALRCYKGDFEDKLR